MVIKFFFFYVFSFGIATELKNFEIMVACELYANDKIKENSSDVLVHEANILLAKVNSMVGKLAADSIEYHTNRRAARCNRYNDDPLKNSHFNEYKYDDILDPKMYSKF